MVGEIGLAGGEICVSCNLKLEIIVRQNKVGHYF